MIWGHHDLGSPWVEAAMIWGHDGLEVGSPWVGVTMGWYWEPHGLESP